MKYICRDCKKEIPEGQIYYVRQRKWVTTNGYGEWKDNGFFGKEWECRTCWYEKWLSKQREKMKAEEEVVIGGYRGDDLEEQIE